MRAPLSLASSLVMLSIAFSGCAPAAQNVLAPTDAPALPNDIKWYRTAAERDALFVQTYRLAEEQVRDLARGRQPGTWAVILDADETVLDNSPYQERRAALGLGFTPDTWNAWVREGTAVALPGALSFIRRVHALGGKAIIVTNRGDEVCPETKANLVEEGFDVDLVLCKPEGQSDKNPRFGSVEAGTATADLPALEVLAYVGDNIMDFPGMDQNARGNSQAFQLFGRKYFILPNPMYGSWERY